MSRSPGVAVIYHFFPHYRAPVLRALAASSRLSFSFWGAHSGVEGIEPFVGDAEVSVNPISLNERRGRYYLRGYMSAVFAKDIRALIILGNPNIRSTWWMATLGRLTGKKVFFWAHGWLRPEPWLKSTLRNLYFRLADGVLVYSDRAKRLAAASGFPSARVQPIYNSLDWSASQPLYDELQGLDPATLRAEVTPWPELPLFICTARLTELCRFDLLLEAMAVLEREGMPTNLILVGDGPERLRLETIARENALKVQFKGAIYEEAVLAKLLYASDITVSPGKVGLTAMHSLTYGTPVITHGDLDAQMPEVEAVRGNETGAFFERNSVDDLARVLAAWINAKHDRATVRLQCRAVIEQRYTPVAQQHRIEAAILEAL